MGPCTFFTDGSLSFLPDVSVERTGSLSVDTKHFEYNDLSSTFDTKAMHSSNFDTKFLFNVGGSDFEQKDTRHASNRTVFITACNTLVLLQPLTIANQHSQISGRELSGTFFCFR